MPLYGAFGSLFFALLAAAPLVLHAGFLNTRGGGDSPFLLFRLHQLEAALRDGVFPVRWMPDAAFGLGYPFFSYYAAFPYYVAAAFRLMGFSYVLSLKLTHLLGFALAAWGMFAWIRRVTGRLDQALLASIAYTFAPYHLVNVYVRGDSLVEFWAMAWCPIVLLAVHVAARRPTARSLAGAAFAYGALVMTHNISALIFSPFVALYALFSALEQAPAGEAQPIRGRVRLVALLTLALLLGLALSAWVWLPALGERHVVQLGEQITGYFFYGNHFRSGNLIQPSVLFSYGIGGERTTPFSMGLVQSILTGAGAFVLVHRMIRKRTWLRDGFLLFGLGLSTLMITPLSRLLWDHIPLLPFAQFPWRFLSVQACFSAAVTAALLIDSLPHKVSLFAALMVGIVLAAAALGALRLNFIPLTDADVTAQRLQWYESFSGNIGTTIRHEYLPVWANPRPYTSDILLGREPRAKFLSGEGVAQRVQVRAASQEWAFDVQGSQAQVALPLLYWPGWQASVDGERVALSPVDGLGYVQLSLPYGQHAVRLQLAHTPLRLAAELLSLGALIGGIVLWRPRLLALNQRHLMWGGAGLVGVAALAASLHGLPLPPTADQTLTADFAQQAYFHNNPGGVQFENGARLLSYQAEVTSASTIRLHMLWQPANHPARLAASLAPPPQQAERGAPGIVLGQSHILSPDEYWARGLDAPFPPGLYVFCLDLTDTSESAQGVFALTSSGEKRGPVCLEPVIVEPEANPTWGRPLEASFGPIRLEAMNTFETPGALQVAATWQTGQEIARNYAIALRLYDPAGNEWAALDTQAGGGGLYPTGLWRPDELVPDRYTLALPPGTPPGSGYRLELRLYDGATLEVVGEVALNEVVIAQSWPFTGESVPLGGEIALGGVTVPSEIVAGDPLPVEVRWVTREFGWLLPNIGGPPTQSYQVRWRRAITH